jgi:hypothetical protein
MLDSRRAAADLLPAVGDAKDHLAAPVAGVEPLVDRDEFLQRADVVDERRDLPA